MAKYKWRMGRRGDLISPYYLDVKHLKLFIDFFLNLWYYISVPRERKRTPDHVEIRQRMRNSSAVDARGMEKQTSLASPL